MTYFVGFGLKKWNQRGFMWGFSSYTLRRIGETCSIWISLSLEEMRLDLAIVGARLGRMFHLVTKYRGKLVFSSMRFVTGHFPLVQLP